MQVNAAGDLTLRGGVVEKGVAGPWKIGVVNPDNRQGVLRIFEIHDGAIATSGTYERGPLSLIRRRGRLLLVRNQRRCLGQMVV